MKSRSFQILINAVSVLWCPPEWVSKIKTDSSGLTLTVYYSAAVTSFFAAFTKTSFSPIYDPPSHIVCPEFCRTASVARGCLVDHVQDYQTDLKITLEQGKSTVFLLLRLVDVVDVDLFCGAHSKKASPPMAVWKQKRQLMWCLLIVFVTPSKDCKPFDEKGTLQMSLASSRDLIDLRYSKEAYCHLNFALKKEPRDPTLCSLDGIFWSRREMSMVSVIPFCSKVRLAKKPSYAHWPIWDWSSALSVKDKIH